MKVQILIAALVTIASSAPTEAPTKLPVDTESIALCTRAINSVLLGISKSEKGVFFDHRAHISSPYGFYIQGDVLFNGSRFEGLEDIMMVKEITAKEEEAYQRIRGVIRVPHYKVTSSVTFNVTRFSDDYLSYDRDSNFKRITWGVESIADMEWELELSFNYFKKFNRISRLELDYSHESPFPEMQTTLKYPTDHGWPELGVELEPYVKRFFRQAPMVLLSWLEDRFQDMSLE